MLGTEPTRAGSMREQGTSARCAIIKLLKPRDQRWAGIRRATPTSCLPLGRVALDNEVVEIGGLM
jgi:hypothetical protein